VTTPPPPTPTTTNGTDLVAAQPTTSAGSPAYGATSDATSAASHELTGSAVPEEALSVPRPAPIETAVGAPVGEPVGEPVGAAFGAAEEMTPVGRGSGPWAKKPTDVPDAEALVRSALQDVKVRMGTTGWKHWSEKAVRSSVEAKMAVAAAASSQALAPAPPQAAKSPNPFADVVNRLRAETAAPQNAATQVKPAPQVQRGPTANDESGTDPDKSRRGFF
jgi:hypothetical protein